MKAVLKWLAGIVSSVLTLVLVIVLLPYFGVFADSILPDISGAHIKNAAILSRQMQESARLETMKVSCEGVMNAEREAAFIGTVSSVNVNYAFNGSFGIDLSQVQLSVRGNQLTFTLPEPVLMSDTITILESHRDGILDARVRFSDTELQELLNVEKQKICEQYLTGEYAQALRDQTIATFENSIAAWLSQTNGRFEYTYRWADHTAENAAGAE